MSGLSRSAKKNEWPVRLIILARAITIGVAYYNVSGIPGVTSSFISILGSLLIFDTFIAMDQLTTGYRDLVGIIKNQILPRAAGTGLALLRGLAVGVLFGILTKMGFPVVLATVLTMGLAFTVSEFTKNNMSDFVGLIGALAVYNKLLALPDIKNVADFYQTVGNILWTTGSGTFLALASGMVIGSVTGLVTRIFLPRGYRSKRSQAYGQPLDLQPFREVIELDQGRVTAHVALSANSPFAHKSLAETGLLSRYDTRVLAIQRQGNTISLPLGTEVLLPGDSIFILAPIPKLEQVTAIVRGEERLQGEESNYGQ